MTGCAPPNMCTGIVGQPFSSDISFFRPELHSECPYPWASMYTVETLDFYRFFVESNFTTNFSTKRGVRQARYASINLQHVGRTTLVV